MPWRASAAGAANFIRGSGGGIDAAQMISNAAAPSHGARGIAFSGYGGIKRVEVSTDDGANWGEARLGTDAGEYSFRTWAFDWTPKAPGRYRLAVRATDAKGSTQPDEGVWNPGGYLWNKIEHQEIVVGDAS